MQAEALEYILMEFPYTCLAGKKEAGLLATISAQILIALDVSDTQRIGALCSVVNSIVRLSRIPPMLDSVVVAFADCKKIGTFLLKCINVLSTHAESIVQSHAGRLTTSSIRQLVRMLRAIAFSADCLKRYKLPDAVLVVLSRSLSTLVAMMSLVGLHGLSSDLAGRGVLAALAIFDTLSRNSCSQNLMDVSST